MKEINEQIRKIEEKIKEYNYNYLKAVSNFVTADINDVYACLEEVKRYEGFMVEAAYLKKELCKLIEIFPGSTFVFGPTNDLIGLYLKTKSEERVCNGRGVHGQYITLWVGWCWHEPCVTMKGCTVYPPVLWWMCSYATDYDPGHTLPCGVME